MKSPSFYQDVFSGNTNLVVLQLGGNDISEVPENAFVGPTHLEVLKVGFNNITEFPGKLLEPLSKLKELILSGNTLSTWPDLTLLPKVHNLYLQVDFIENNFNSPYLVPRSVCRVNAATFTRVHYLCLIVQRIKLPCIR